LQLARMVVIGTSWRDFNGGNEFRTSFQAGY